MMAIKVTGTTALMNAAAIHQICMPLSRPAPPPQRNSPPQEEPA
jgi:hypothetical protein